MRYYLLRGLVTALVLYGFSHGTDCSLRAQSAVPPSAGETAIATAAQENKYLFILFWKEDDLTGRTMWQTLKTAVGKYQQYAKTLQVQVTNPAEKVLVDRYGLSRTPMPLVLALAPNGAITGGYPLTLTEQNVASSFVSPGMAACLKATQARRLVLLCVQPRRNIARLHCHAADWSPQLQGGPTIRAIHRLGEPSGPTMQAEASFLQSLKISRMASSSRCCWLRRARS